MDTTEIHGVELRTDGDMVVLSNNRNGFFEKDTFDNFSKLISFFKNTQRIENPIFADIGAYTGIYSIYAAKLGCRVEAFEPNPNVFERLVENVNHNYDNMGGWSGVINYNRCALSDEVGEATFNVNPNVLLTSGGSLNPNIRPNKQKFVVEVDKYDNYLMPDIVKIDVEGNEMKVLAGMKNTLLHGEVFMIIEANTKEEQDNIVRFMQDEIGYVFQGRFDDRNLIFSPRWFSLQSVNVQ